MTGQLREAKSDRKHYSLNVYVSLYIYPAVEKRIVQISDGLYLIIVPNFNPE